jgi:hypothetical protein
VQWVPYVLNNPLRYVDPDGLEVPESCVNDEKCKIQVRVNIIYDTQANKGKGITPEQMAKARKEQKRAEAILQNANVQVQTTETTGAVAASGSITGVDKNAMNIFVSDQRVSGQGNGKGGSGTIEGVPVTQVNINTISTDTWIPAFGPTFLASYTPTWVHEYGEQLLHVGRQQGVAENLFADSHVDLLMQGLTGSVPGYAGAARSLLGEKRYAVPATPEANKPRQ